ncbi:MAG: ATP-binding protein [Bacteroidota bacterium]
MNYSYKVPCSKERLQDIRAFVNEALSNHGLTEVEISTLVLAIDEVCANVIIHSHKCDPKESLEVDIKVRKNDGIVFDIIDNGVPGFDINEYIEPSIKDIVKKQRKGGIGLILVKRIMDKIEFISDSNKNICRLYKKSEVIR